MNSISHVSIVIPCFNDGKYLQDAVASACAQTHPSTEIIIVDDHSTDPLTLAAYDRLRNEGITVLETPQGKKGPSVARNTGITKATGNYILPLDADDTIAPSYISKAVAVLDANPAIDICYCRARFMGLKSGPWKLPSYSFEKLLCENMIFATALFRKTAWVDAGGYDESLILGLEDYAFWLHLTDRGSQVYQLEDELFFYRIKSGSRTAKARQKDKYTQMLTMLHTSCSDIFARHSDVLLQKIVELKSERDQQECLFSWKLIKPFLRLEWTLRQLIKKFIGRIDGS